MKRGNTEQATQAYSQVAEQFAKSGFDAKAVAIYKQILRVDASCLNAHMRLGDLFQRLGLTSDALREFQQGIQLCEERGLKREAFDLLKRVASLDPSNVPNRLRLADLFERQDLKDEARAEYASLLKEVQQGEEQEPDQIMRVCEQMLSSFPDEPEAIAALGHAKIALGESAEAVSLLAEALPRFAVNIEIREAIVAAYEVEGELDAAQPVYHEMAAIYKERGEEDRARSLVQRFVTMDSISEPDTSPSIVLDEAVEGESSALNLGTSQSEMPFDDEDCTQDLLAEARISFEFGDMAGARNRLTSLLELRPQNAEARQLLAQIPGDDSSSPRLDIESNSLQPEEPEPPTPDLMSVPDAFQEADDTSATNDPADGADETLPDIELMLEDDHDRDSTYASVEPPPELQEAELEIDFDDTGAFDFEVAPAGVVSKTSKPAMDESASENDPASEWGTDSMRLSADLEEAEFFFQQSMLDEAEKAYVEIQKRAPNHPKVSLRLGEIADLRQKPGKKEPEAEPAVVLQQPPRRAPAPEAARSVEEDSFDLAAELDSSTDDTDDLAMGGFEEVFRAFKREIDDQVGADEYETHYDLAIAYKEMELLDDAVSELAIVRSSGRMPIQDFAVLLASCKLGLGQPQDAVAVLEEALGSGGADQATMVSLRYELGEAFLAAGQTQQAREAFQKVAAADPDYREVQNRVAELG